ncbi:MAG: hypothetical protein KA265_17975 [Piscinibacter sp.]|nr:hypothetical protein [Piscinibacter sp.]
MNQTLNLIQRIATALLVLGLSGCANLAAIQEFGRLSADGAGYTKLTQDYLSVPDRARKYAQGSGADQSAALDALKAKRDAQAEGLSLQHKAVTDYMEAIASLAADDVPSFDEPLGGLVDAATSASQIPANVAGPLKSVGSLLVSAVADGYRQRQLTQVIEAGNVPLQAILRDLTTTIKAFELDSEIELDRFDGYYQFLMLTAGAKAERGKAPEPAALFFIRDAYQEQRPAFAERSKQIAKYQETLTAIAEGHQKLYDHRDQISSPELLRQVKGYSTRIRGAIKAIRNP